MSLPLGHFAVGLTTHEFASDNTSSPFRRPDLALYIALLANLPDIDVVAGLVLQGNGNAFHRGVTHSIIFALFAGFLASRAWKLCDRIPKVGFSICFVIILSHLFADFFFSGGPVPFLWPLEFKVSSGYKGWSDVFNSVFLQAYQDFGVIMVCGAAIACQRLARAEFGSLRPKLQFIRYGTRRKDRQSDRHE